MTNAIIPKPVKTNAQRITYGALSGGQEFSGMKTLPFVGKGEQLVENMQISTGKYKKMTGNSIFKTLTLTAPVLHSFDYTKSDGTHQRLTVQKSGTKYKLRAVADDGTESTPTGGAGDVEFTSPNFYFRQLGNTGFIGNNSATTPLYSWNGTLLTATSNAPASPIGLLKDGLRLVVLTKTQAQFSGDGIATGNDFTAGAGVSAYGEYKTSLKLTGGIEAGAGVILFGEFGAEAHLVRVNDASDAVSSDTKVSSEAFRYTGRGISNTYRVATGKQYVYFLNDEGLFRMNPFSGEANNLLDDSGKIGKYFDTLSIDNSKVVYSSKEDAIVTSVSSGSVTNDRLMCYFEDTDAFSFKTRVYSEGLGTVENQLYSGENGGQLVKVFDDSIYSDKNGASVTARVIGEWNAVGNVHTLKTFLKSGIFASLSADSTMNVSVYFDGYIDAVDSADYTTEDATSTSGVVGQMGLYLMAIGRGDEFNNTDIIERKRRVKQFITFCVGVEEISDDPFEFTSSYCDISSYGTDTISSVLANQLFTLST